MKRRLSVYACLLLVVAAAVVYPAHADDTTVPVMTDAHIQRIKNNCEDVLHTIQQLRASDALLRVDRGEAYDSMSTKLMAPFNSRLVLNKLDGSALVKITANYDQTLSSFRSDYKSYYDQMTDVLQIDCTKQPVEFYDAVSKARDLRNSVHADVVLMNKLIGDYSKAFSTFQTQFTTSTPKTGEGE